MEFDFINSKIHKKDNPFDWVRFSIGLFVYIPIVVTVFKFWIDLFF